MTADDHTRRALVIHDGDGTWFIQQGDDVELTAAGSTTLINADRVHTVRGSVVANNWVKMMIQGRLIAYLAESTGSVIGRSDWFGRPCWIADVRGLKDGEPKGSWTLWVDVDTGVVVRMLGTDEALGTVELRDVEFGTDESVVAGPESEPGDTSFDGAGS